MFLINLWREIQTCIIHIKLKSYHQSKHQVWLVCVFSRVRGQNKCGLGNSERKQIKHDRMLCCLGEVSLETHEKRAKIR